MKDQLKIGVRKAYAKALPLKSQVEKMVSFQNHPQLTESIQHFVQDKEQGDIIMRNYDDIKKEKAGRLFSSKNFIY